MTQSTCADCQAAEGALEVRKRRLCPDCFIKYVQSKTVKRMESYRFKDLPEGQKKRVFLPLSGGVSSLALLQILDTQLQRQIVKRNRTSYELIIAHVGSSSGLDEDDNEVGSEWYEQVSKRFPNHTFLPVIAIHEIFEKDSTIEADLSLLGYSKKPSQSNQDFYRSLLSASTTETTRTDLREILQRRLLVTLAKQNECESILWGHSDSKLAAQVLSDVAKGRGGSIPADIADGQSAAHGINFNYPVRDLFKTELDLYAGVLSEPITDLVRKESDALPVASLRNTSIDVLLSNYINSQGEKYPSIMANVVRTTSKLQVKRTVEEDGCCSVCYAEIDPGLDKNASAAKLCYGCRRMKQDIKPL